MMVTAVCIKNVLVEEMSPNSEQQTLLLGQLVKVDYQLDDSTLVVRALKDGDSWQANQFRCAHKDVAIMSEQCSEKLWRFVASIPSSKDRQRFVRDRKRVEQLCRLQLDMVVGFTDTVDILLGRVKFMGKVKGIGHCVGLHLHEKKEFNKCDGSAAGTCYFKCPVGHGIFTTIDRIRPIDCPYNSEPKRRIDDIEQQHSLTLPPIRDKHITYVSSVDFYTKRHQWEQRSSSTNRAVGGGGSGASTANHRIAPPATLEALPSNGGIGNAVKTSVSWESQAPPTVNTTNDFDQNTMISPDRQYLIEGRVTGSAPRSATTNGVDESTQCSRVFSEKNAKLYTRTGNSGHCDTLLPTTKKFSGSAFSAMVENFNSLPRRTKLMQPKSNSQFYVNHNSNRSNIDDGDEQKENVNDEKLGKKLNQQMEQEEQQQLLLTNSSEQQCRTQYREPLAGTTNNLTVGSLVQVSNDVTSTDLYGVIRWMGVDTERNYILIGVELDEDHAQLLPLTLTDGTHNQVRYFTCAPQRALFVPLEQCHRDKRFEEDEPVDLEEAEEEELKEVESRKNSKDKADKDNDKGVSPMIVQDNDPQTVESPVITGSVPPLFTPTEEDVRAICGKFRGIQGHHNSCYLDVTLFAMFTYTAVFDSLLFRPKHQSDIAEYMEVQRVLREEIVNPLRKNLFVSADHVMNLRRLLARLSSVSGLTSEEKDPEEFLNCLLTQTLKAEPFLKLNSGQESFYYQLFMEKDADLSLPSVQQLFEQSFFMSQIKLKEVPSCLIVQMPRFGKTYKMYPRIVPTQLLDVTDVIEGSPRLCTVCGKLARWECRDCFDQGNATLEAIVYCYDCVKMAHRHELRKHHQPIELQDVTGAFACLDQQANIRPPRLYMELFAVICIETSHYVTFVKCGVGHEAPWCFFDSMADRKGERNGYNIPEMVVCPDVSRWLSDDALCRNLHEQFPLDRHLPERARRLLCDAYICMYQSSDVMMYR